jgi:endonuclease YncB( thermonuclease family)
MRLFLLFFILLFFCSFTAVRPLLAVPATVGYVIDGDTFSARVLLEDDIRISVRIRIINVDAPEISGECASEIKLAARAKNRLAELIPVGGIVDLSEIKDDKYLGRIDARVKTKNGADVGEILIKEKLARPYNGGKRQSWCDGNMNASIQNRK